LFLALPYLYGLSFITLGKDLSLLMGNFTICGMLYISHISSGVRVSYSRLMEHIRDNPSKDVYEDDFFSIRYFQKGTAHITFKRYDLTEKMNDIVAKHYPGMLAAR